MTTDKRHRPGPCETGGRHRRLAATRLDEFRKSDALWGRGFTISSKPMSINGGNHEGVLLGVWTQLKLNHWGAKGEVDFFKILWILAIGNRDKGVGIGRARWRQDEGCVMESFWKFWKSQKVLKIEPSEMLPKNEEKGLCGPGSKFWKF